MICLFFCLYDFGVPKCSRNVQRINKNDVKKTNSRKKSIKCVQKTDCLRLLLPLPITAVSMYPLPFLNAGKLRQCTATSHMWQRGGPNIKKVGKVSETLVKTYLRFFQKIYQESCDGLRSGQIWGRAVSKNNCSTPRSAPTRTFEKRCFFFREMYEYGASALIGVEQSA